jgi:uncharacterized protein (DUF433 family)
MSRLERITSDPTICHGKPCVRGLRYPVGVLLELLAAGMSFEAILDDFPDLERDDILAVLEYAAIATRVGTIVPISAA